MHLAEKQRISERFKADWGKMEIQSFSVSMGDWFQNPLRCHNPQVLKSLIYKSVVSAYNLHTSSRIL